MAPRTTGVALRCVPPCIYFTEQPILSSVATGLSVMQNTKRQTTCKVVLVHNRGSCWTNWAAASVEFPALAPGLFWVSFLSVEFCHDCHSPGQLMMNDIRCRQFLSVSSSCPVRSSSQFSKPSSSQSVLLSHQFVFLSCSSAFFFCFFFLSSVLSSSLLFLLLKCSPNITLTN